MMHVRYQKHCGKQSDVEAPDANTADNQDDDQGQKNIEPHIAVLRHSHRRQREHPEYGKQDCKLLSEKQGRKRADSNKRCANPSYPVRQTLGKRVRTANKGEGSGKPSMLRNRGEVFRRFLRILFSRGSIRLALREAVKSIPWRIAGQTQQANSDQWYGCGPQRNAESNARSGLSGKRKDGRKKEESEK